jgi:uncharacterized protein YndB with AHSA1/START domain
VPVERSNAASTPPSPQAEPRGRRQPRRPTDHDGDLRRPRRQDAAHGPDPLRIRCGPDGTDYKNKIIYVEVVRPERLVYEHTGDEGTEPVNFHVTITFAEEGDKTRLTMHALFPSAAAREHVITKYGADEGMKQNLERLEAYLAKAGGR